MDPVTAYRAYWHAESNTGRLYLKLASNATAEIAIDSPAELEAMVRLLREHPSVSYDAAEKLLSTDWHKAGSDHS
jgi:hypothetical protein